ncbi:MAG TPA: glutamate--tRNA ligase [Methanoregulaceae archaeon]|nr:MAG: glutamate--tRNA ligase [Methanolinea sp.]HON81190.1 glutamate--tRNA ligase [Methanoregulaceae archaeon]HPD09866.1 glutamate--tRNA ligase [Methanoregulaceae archaeon]HRT14943.1 glutamate--tRNA ligase [Methanoregulaceae archaeon]HRU30442.1 glutamate--tRNA ligase [Methanoregulaceae archaeon]
MADELREVLFIFALQNAVKHKSLPKAGTVIGMVMGKHPEFRSRAKEVAAVMASVLAEVAALSSTEREERLAALAPDFTENMTKPRVHARELPFLENAEHGVVMRFAPNPSGPLHLGHARAAVLNDAYVQRYGGKYILRIEDTDPKRVDPDAYAMVREDIEWLGLTIHEVVYQSDRFDLYYRYGRELVERGGAYVCTCENEQFRQLKLARRACPCRGLTVDENLGLWERMIAGEFYDGEASVRVRTELEHPDPAMRDFPAFRILHVPLHPRIEAHVYPLMNFSVAVDDHLLGVTHVIRGKDHIANTRRQRYIFDYFGWPVPVYRHYGRMGIEGVILSTSQMRQEIRSGACRGWDDIRLGTLRALARRGIQPGAVRAAMIEIGIGDTDISFSWDNLYAHNRTIVDPIADRYFFVPDPVCLKVRDAPVHTARPLLHPNDAARGTRTLPFLGEVLIPREEIGKAPDMIRLKDLFNVRVGVSDEEYILAYAGEDLADARALKAPIIQWLPAELALPAILETQDGPVSGVCEPAAGTLQGKVVQFERVGFARIDHVEPQELIAYFCHR